MLTTTSHPRSARRTTFVLALAVLRVVTWAAQANAQADNMSELPSPQFVIGGTPASDCQWPSTVRVDPAQCTGTLIHPRVVATAAHCMTGTTASIGFGNKGAPGGFSVSARCVAGARGSSGANTARDWAYCILPEDPRIAKIPITPPLVGCEAELVKAGSMAWVVGYGSTTPRGPVGPKRQVEVKINQYNKLAPSTIDVGDRYSGACHGDSGGPLYVRLTRNGVDYGVRILGSTSGAGGQCDCTCSTTYINIENHVKAVEKNEGIDVTPCTDADGKWDPSPACSGLGTAPETGTGSYPECVVPRTTAPIESCGANTNAGADAGTDAGAGLDRDAGPDAGGRGDAGTRRDGGSDDSDSDGGAKLDAGGSRARDAGRTPADAGYASRDAGRGADEEESNEDEDEDEDKDKKAPKPRPVDQSGCSALRTDRSDQTLGLLLFGLAVAHARRRRRAR